MSKQPKTLSTHSPVRDSPYRPRSSRFKRWIRILTATGGAIGGSGGLVFMGGELTGVSEKAPGCDVSVDPDSCPAVLRSPYYAEVSYLGDGGCGG
jgi:hypothetical protein